jgi:transcriptional regulator with XRE-family HTH domain
MYDVFEKLLKEHNFTAYKVAKDTGISYSTFSDWKAGRSSPKPDKLEKIADYFDISIDKLMGRNETEKRYNEFLGLIEDEFNFRNHESIKLTAEECKSTRINKDLTEKFVANKADVPLSEYINFENGEYIAPDKAIRVLTFLEIDPAYLYGLIAGKHVSDYKNLSELLNELPLEDSTKQIAMFLSKQDPNYLKQIITETLSNDEINAYIKISEYAKRLMEGR